MPLAAVAAFLGATLQSATGFGFALVLGPALIAVLTPAEALTTLLVLSASLNLLMLFSERRRRSIRWSDVLLLLAAAAPGLVGGVFLLSVASRAELQIAVGVTVLLAVGFHVRRVRGPEPMGGASSPPWAAAAVGVVTGGLTTTTNVNGPPLVLWFQRRGATPGELRDSVAAGSLPLNVAGAFLLAVLGDQEQSFVAEAILPLLALTVAGQLAGRRMFERFSAERFARAGIVLATLAGVSSLAYGVASLAG